MAVLINGNGNEAIYAQQDADWFASIMGNQTAITGIGNKFAASLLDANTIGVSDGVIITQEGRRIQLDVNEIDSFDIPAGGQGETNYYIIGYHLVTGDLSEQYCETFVRLMDNDTDTIPEDTFRGGADEVFVSLYRVTQDDLVITDMDLLLPEITNLSQNNQELSELKEDLNNVINYIGYDPSIHRQWLFNNGTVSGFAWYPSTNEADFGLSAGYSAGISNISAEMVFGDNGGGFGIGGVLSSPISLANKNRLTIEFNSIQGSGGSAAADSRLSQIMLYGNGAFTSLWSRNNLEVGYMPVTLDVSSYNDEYQIVLVALSGAQMAYTQVCTVAKVYLD